MRRERKATAYKKGKEAEILQKERLLQLEHENSILKRYAKPLPFRDSRDMLQSCTARMVYREQEKYISINKKITFKPIEFQPHDVEIDKDLNKGVFGQLSKGYIRTMKQIVAIKKIIRSPRLNEICAECKIGMLLSGNKYFPYMFGYMKPDSILMEFIRDDNGKSSPTLSQVLKNSVALENHLFIAIDLCLAIHEMHKKGVLHNDLHGKNIIIQSVCSVKIIDFGKATLITDPVVYNIKPGSAKQQKYDKYHPFLATELRSKPGSNQSVKTDIFSIGYNFNAIAKFVGSECLSLLASRMMNVDSDKRPSLSSCISFLEKSKLNK